MDEDPISKAVFDAAVLMDKKLDGIIDNIFSNIRLNKLLSCT